MQPGKKYVASLDQSTTTTKFSLYDFHGSLLCQEVVPHEQIAKHEGWLEHNPMEILDNVDKSIRAVIQKMTGNQQFSAQQIIGLGICNQRETIVCWDPTTLQPYYNAIVWCDSRTKHVCDDFKQKHGSFVKRTGLPVSTYFSLFKILWLLENVEGLRQKLQQDRVRFGTMDTWVTLHLTGKYVTDASNASRTHILDINTGCWDKQLLQIAGLGEEHLPQIVDSFHTVGAINHGPLSGVPVSCILGDQQSSAYAHRLSQTEMKITYGTGCFMLSPIGRQPLYDEAFVTTILSQEQGVREYGYEVSVQCGGGTVNWAKRVGLLADYSELNILPEAESTGQSGQQLFFMPSFGSIFSPFWLSNISGGLLNLTFNTQKAHILKSILNSITYRLYDNIKNPHFAPVTKIIVDGGMTVNPHFMQDQADLFRKEIEVRKLDTCWGVAHGALRAQGVQEQVRLEASQVYKPRQGAWEHQHEGYRRWEAARARFYGWKH